MGEGEELSRGKKRKEKGEGDRQLEHRTEGSPRPQSALRALSSPEE